MSDLFQIEYAPPAWTLNAVQSALIQKGFGTAANVGPPAILTHPQEDYEGDIVVPDGGTWIDSPLVNFDHGPPVGVAARPVDLRSILFKGVRHNVPIGQTRFFEKESDLQNIPLVARDRFDKVIKSYTHREVLSLAAQSAKLVSDGTVSGVSVEFKPEEFREIGPSALRGVNGKAFEFTRWKGLGWAHTRTPVNSQARILEEDKIYKALEDPNLPEVIRKSLSAGLAPRKTIVKGNFEPVAVPVNGLLNGLKGAKIIPVKKAIGGDDMDEEIGDGSADGLGTPGDTENMGEMPGVGVKAHFDTAQQLLDLCANFEMMMQQSDSVELRRDATKVCATLRKMADEVQARGEKHAAKLSGEPDEAVDNDGNDDSPEPVDTDDETGEIKSKSFPDYRPTRFKVSDLGPPVKKATKKPAPELALAEDDVVLSRAQYERLLNNR